MNNDFMAGGITFGFLVISIYFVKFWRRLRDPLFGAFALAFLLLSIERIIEVTLRGANIHSPLLYLIRFFAFCLIILAIVRKNLFPKNR
jgi:hypothetical protein